MTGWMTYGSKKHDSAEKTVTSILPVLHKTIDQITPLIDADAMAFSNYLVAQKMPAVGVYDNASFLALGIYKFRFQHRIYIVYFI